MRRRECGFMSSAGSRGWGASGRERESVEWSIAGRAAGMPMISTGVEC